MSMTALLQPDVLTDRQKRSGVFALMLTTFFSWGGFFMVIPLVAVHYVEHLGWSAATIGILLGIRQVVQQSLTTVFGMAADRVGAKPLICAGMLMRAVGFASLAWSDTFLEMVLSMLLAALGGGAFDSPKSAALAALSTPENRQRVFSLAGVVAGLGTTLGAQVGALLIPYDFALVCYAGASAYVIVFVHVLLRMPAVAVATGTHTPLAGLRLVLRDRGFMVFVAILGGFWFCYAQFGLTIALAATNIAGTDAAVSWIYAVNAIATIGLGYTLPRLLERWVKPMGLLIGGVVVVAVGLGMVGLAGSTSDLLVAALIYSVGTVVARPAQETVTANLARPELRGTYFGVAALSLAIGGGLGNFLGGLIYAQGDADAHPAGPWLVFAAIAVATAALLAAYWRAERARLARLGNMVSTPSPPPGPGTE